MPGAGLPVADSHLTASTPFFPMGWFDQIKTPSRLPGMRSAGMNSVLPYTETAAGSVRSYLDRARSYGLKVFVEIDRSLLMPPNPVLIKRFVEQHRGHSAVQGWLLADEPTIKPEYRAFTPDIAKLLYKQIKGADPKRPVAIVFGVSEDPRPFLPAMDVFMYDDYVADYGTPEFRGLWGWRNRLIQRGTWARSLNGYIPVLQGFGQDINGKPHIGKRLPTSKEMRYISYTAVQYNATGLLFWVRYRSRTDWVTKVLTPISKEMAPALRAIGAGPISGVKVSGSAMRTTLFRDPSSRALYLVAVHHGLGNAKATITFSSSLNVDKATQSSGTTTVSSNKLVSTFGPYAARLYRLS